MAKPRINLQKEFEALLGSRNVYFEPPENLQLRYPCIVYFLNRVATTKADNTNYLKYNNYSVRYIHTNPDDPLKDEILDHFMYCAFDKRYNSSNLIHDSFTIFY